MSIDFFTNKIMELSDLISAIEPEKWRMLHNFFFIKMLFIRIPQLKIAWKYEQAKNIAEHLDSYIKSPQNEAYQ